MFEKDTEKQVGASSQLAAASTTATSATAADSSKWVKFSNEDEKTRRIEELERENTELRGQLYILKAMIKNFYEMSVKPGQIPPPQTENYDVDTPNKPASINFTK